VNINKKKQQQQQPTIIQFNIKNYKLLIMLKKIKMKKKTIIKGEKSQQKNNS